MLLLISNLVNSTAKLKYHRTCGEMILLVNGPSSSCDILKHRYSNHKKHTVLKKKEFLFIKKLQISYDDVFKSSPETLIPLAQQ